MNTKLITKIILASTLSWYFLANGNNGAVQVGPFKTQAACENYRAQVSNLGLESLQCFDSTAKS